MSDLQRDPWLSDILEVESFRLRDSAELNFRDLTNNNVEFVWAKTPVSDGVSRVNLEILGFRVVEGSVTFERAPSLIGERLVGVREACPEDEESVALIAQRSFQFDRFHQDPLISDEKANRLKSEWVRNYFRGSRGDLMLVCERDGMVAGFLLAVNNDLRTVVIDLIGTSTEFQKQGVGSELLMGLRDLTGKSIRAGTQFSNLPSVRMYVRHGFLPTRAEWTMHFHRGE